MSVLINFKICDNAKECGGISICPTGALSYDDEKETIVIDNDKCVSCGACEVECPVGAIMVARNEKEYNEIKEEIDKDERTIKDLFVDRYGAAPLSEFFMIDENEINSKISNNNLVLIELYNDDSIECLLKSIPIKELTKDMSKYTLFYKVNVTEKIMKEYNIKDLPALLIFKKGALLGSIEGYFTIDEKEGFLNKINEMI